MDPAGFNEKNENGIVAQQTDLSNDVKEYNGRTVEVQQTVNEDSQDVKDKIIYIRKQIALYSELVDETSKGLTSDDLALIDSIMNKHRNIQGNEKANGTSCPSAITMAKVALLAGIVLGLYLKYSN